MNAVTKTNLNRVLNLALLFESAFLLGSGWALAERLPHGRRGQNLLLLGLDRHDWRELHTWAGYAIAALVVIHLLLHIPWLRQVAARTRTWPLVTGLGAALAGIALFVFAPVTG